MSTPAHDSDYIVVRRLGGGGMAEVFLAERSGPAGFRREVVVKRLDVALARDPDAVSLFLDEARTASRLHHHNICQVFDFGEDAAGFFLAMELLDGCDLRTLIARSPEGVPLAAAVAIVHGAASGLAYAHALERDGRSLGIVHRDVTAGNVFVTRAGAVKLIDFGIARAADRTTRTRTGLVRGTAVYMSPEQASGLEVDSRSDLFSLGIVLYELVCGRRPFDAGNEADLVVMRRIETGIYTSPSELRRDCPAGLEALIAKLLEVDPALRPASGGAVASMLEDIGRTCGWSLTASTLAAMMAAIVPAPSDGEAPTGETRLEPARVEPAPPGEAETRLERPARSAPASSAPRPRWWVYGAALGAIVTVSTIALLAVRGTGDAPHDGAAVVTSPQVDASRALPVARDAGEVTDATSCLAEVEQVLATLGADDRLHPYDQRVYLELAFSYLGVGSLWLHTEDCRRAGVERAPGYATVSARVDRFARTVSARETELGLIYVRQQSAGTVIYRDRASGDELVPEDARRR